MAVVASMVLTLSTPAQAADAGAAHATVTAGPGGQSFVAPSGATIDVERDGFAVRLQRGVPAPSGVGGLVARPVDGAVPVAGGFGSRSVAGCRACSTDHQGLDFAASAGTPVVAAMAGRVVSAGVVGGYGNQVLVEHADGLRTRYGHLSTIAVRTGQVVAVGELVGAVGSTGVSTGAHLHFEVIVGTRPVDPVPWLRERGVL